MGICEVLTIIFVVCKLFGVITWSWWLVFLPEIIAMVFYILIFALPFVASAHIDRKYFRKKGW